MNIKMVFGILGRVLVIEAVLLLCPLLVGVVYRENTYLSFLLPILGLLAVGLPLSFLRPKDRAIYAKEGFVTVALAWILLSVVGALPFVISGEIPNYANALFETVSGFTTTGASILEDVEVLSRGMLFWRSFTHWLGGMGVLVFILAILPNYNSGLMHVFRAESPGPSAGKLVSKLKHTARILYGIYVIMTLTEMILLLCGGMDFYNSILHAFSTAGTGGFSTKNASIGAFNSVYIEMVVAVFMFLFGINFNLFYLILIGNFKKAIKSEELRVYFIIVVGATLAIAVNILSLVTNFGEAVRYAFFQVTSFSSSTGFGSADIGKWPGLSRAILIGLMVVGACGGSTGGGMKVSRVIILVKSAFTNVRRLIHPRSVVTTRFEGEPLDKDTERNVHTYFILWVTIVVVCTVLLSIEPTEQNDFLTSFTTTLSCIGNIGPAFSYGGAVSNLAFYSPYSKIMLSLVMLIGRLEIFPIIVMFAPRTWRRG